MRTDSDLTLLALIRSCAGIASVKQPLPGATLVWLLANLVRSMDPVPNHMPPVRSFLLPSVWNPVEVKFDQTRNSSTRMHRRLFLRRVTNMLGPG